MRLSTRRTYGHPEARVLGSKRHASAVCDHSLIPRCKLLRLLTRGLAGVRPALKEPVPLPRIKDHFDPAIPQSLSGILSRCEGCCVRGGLGAVPRQSGLAHQKVGERQKKEPGNDRDVDGEGLPLIAPPCRSGYFVRSAIFCVMAFLID